MGRRHCNRDGNIPDLHCPGAMFNGGGEYRPSGTCLFDDLDDLRLDDLLIDLIVKMRYSLFPGRMVTNSPQEQHRRSGTGSTHLFHQGFGVDGLI